MTQEEFDRLVANCQPHPKFKLDWSSYYSIDYADTFLPNVARYQPAHVWMHDGAELFKASNKNNKGVLILNKGKSLFSLVGYSYPTGVLAAENKDKVVVNKHEICIFMEVYLDDTVRMYFKFGDQFRTFLTNYLKEKKIKTTVKTFEDSSYKTKISTIQKFFAPELSHEKLLYFIFAAMKIPFEQEKPLEIKINKVVTKSFAPLGVQNLVTMDMPDANIVLEFEILNQPASSYIFIVKKGQQTIFYESTLQGAVVSASKSNERPPGNPKIQSDEPQVYEPGVHTIEWDGFDSNQIYDSTVMKGEITFEVRALDTEGIVASAEKTVKLKLARKGAKWIDISIDKSNKIANILLRLNLTDGREKGTTCRTTGSGSYAPQTTICPWDKIPATVITSCGFPPLTVRSRSYNDLVALAIHGVEHYWSRNRTTLGIGNGVTINGDAYIVNVRAINARNSKTSMSSLPLMYNTNNSWARSGNTGGNYNDANLDDTVINLLPDGIITRLAYNDGYIFHSNWKDWWAGSKVFMNQGWEYVGNASEDVEFEHTAAHEVGHEILQAYAGTIYSWQHKGSSYYVPQNTKPVGAESYVQEYIYIDYMDWSRGENAPIGESDLMKYYNTRRNRANDVAHEQDVLGLLWLSKVKIK